MKTWFANHSRERGSGPDVPGVKRPPRSRVLDLETKPRKPQEYQAWQRLFYHNEDIQAEYKVAWGQAMNEGWKKSQQVRAPSSDTLCLLML